MSSQTPNIGLYKTDLTDDIKATTIPNTNANWTTIDNQIGILSKNRVNVLDSKYGAVGDGVHDDTANILAAFNAIQNGGVIEFPIPIPAVSATYIVSTLFLNNFNNVTIIGQKGVTIQRKAGTYGNNSDGSTSGIITFENSSNIVVKDIIFDGNKANATTIGGVTATNVLNFYVCNDILVKNIVVQNGYYEGLDFQRCNNQMIINSTFKDCGYCGLNIGGGFIGSQTGATDVTIENNRFYNIYSGVIVSVYVNRVDVKNNFFVNSTCNFSQVVTQSKISGNKFYGASPASAFGDSAISAITAEGDSELIIDGNDIMNPALYGIYVYGSYMPSGPSEGLLPCNDIQITNNKVTGAQQVGILASIGSPWTYNSSTHTATSATEANSTKGQNCIITGNIVSQCIGSGIGVGLGKNVIIANNQTFLNNLHGIVITGSDKVQIKNNEVYNNSKAGVDSYNGIDLGTSTTNTNITIQDNEIFDDQGASRTQRFGIMVNNSQCSNIRVKDNMIYGNGGSVYSLVPLNFITVPATATSPGSPGDWASDGTYLYICHDVNTWKRVAIATW